MPHLIAPYIPQGQNLGAILAVVILSPFILILLVIILGMARGAYKATATRRWPTADGQILSSEVTSHLSLDSNGTHTTIYEPAVHYNYSVNGQVYRSNQIDFSGVAGASFPSMAESVVDKYAVGSPVQVFYNPAKPSESVLEHGGTGVNTVIMVILGAIELILIGIVVVGLTGGLN